MKCQEYIIVLTFRFLATTICIITRYRRHIIELHLSGVYIFCQHSIFSYFCIINFQSIFYMFLKIAVILSTSFQNLLNFSLFWSLFGLNRGKHNNLPRFRTKSDFFSKFWFFAWKICEKIVVKLAYVLHFPINVSFIQFLPHIPRGRGRILENIHPCKMAFSVGLASVCAICRT